MEHVQPAGCRSLAAWRSVTDRHVIRGTRALTRSRRDRRQVWPLTARAARAAPGICAAALSSQFPGAHRLAGSILERSSLFFMLICAPLLFVNIFVVFLDLNLILSTHLLFITEVSSIVLSPTLCTREYSSCPLLLSAFSV